MRIDLVCGRCGDELDGNYDGKKDNLVIDPCKTCLQNEREEGKEEGIKEGKGE